jgi:hypothetical protein
MVQPSAVEAALAAGAITWREEYGEAYPYVLWFNDGARLLRRHVTPDSRVFVMDFSNPFSFALGLRPPRGGALVWHYERDFDAAHFPPADRVFSDVTFVMIPKCPVQRAATVTMRKIYGSALAASFVPIDETPLWELWGRQS